MRLKELDYQVIDMHTHMGPIYCMHYPGSSADGMVKYMDRTGIEMSICAPNEDLFTMPQLYALIEDAMARYPRKIAGYYSVNPCDPPDGKRIMQAFERAPYTGLKLLPDYHHTALNDERYAPALSYANEKHMLVLAHTWGPNTYNSSDKVSAVLERYPHIVLLMGHSIQGEVDAAIELAVHYKNAYLDLCDTGRINGVIEKMVRLAGPDKVVFGSDWPWLMPEYLIGAVYYANIDEDAKKKILRDNALRILKETDQFVAG